MIIRIEKNKENPYIIMHKGFLNEKEMSWQAKGLLTYLLSLPDNWEINLQDLKNRSKNGRDSTTNIIKELISFGYIIKEQKKDKKGRFDKNLFIVGECPLTVNPSTVNPALVYNNSNNTSINRSIEFSDENSRTNKSSTKKEKVPIKKIEKYKNILLRWNKIEKASTHTLDKFTKTLKKALVYLEQLEAGTFCKYTGLTHQWLADNNIPKEWYDKKFTKTEIIKGIKRIALQFEPGYWPFSPEDKKKYLPKTLETSLYNPYGGCKSVFLKVLANAPKQQEEIADPLFPDLVEIYCSNFLKNNFENLSNIEKGKLVKYTNEIGSWHQQQAEILDPIYAETSFDSYFGRKNKPEKFVKTHISFLINKGGIYSNKESFHQNFKPSVSMLDPGGNRWKRFIQDFKKIHGFELEPDEKQIKKLRIMYRV